MDTTTSSTEFDAFDTDEVRISTNEVILYVCFTIGGLGLVGNIFVVIVILSTSSMRKQFTNAYIINQSLVDGVVSLFLVLTTAFEGDGRRYDSILDELFCRLWLTKLGLWGFLVSSSYNILALTLERYLAVVHPIWHKMKLTKSKVAVSIAFIWIFGPAYNMSYMVPTSGTTETNECSVYSFWPNPLLQRAVGVLTIFIQFFFPLALLVLFYTRMIIALRRRVTPEVLGASSINQANRRKSDSMARARKNILKTLGMVAFSFVFCWTWNQIYFLLFNLGVKGIDFTSVFYSYTVVMVFLNCCINPFIYIAKYEQFQKAMKKLFCKNLAATDVITLYVSSIEEHLSR